MKKVLAVCFVAAVLAVFQAKASGSDQILLLPKGGLQGTVERLPRGVFTNSFPHLGSTTVPLNGSQLMVDPTNNVLVFLIYYNINEDQGNFEYSLQEWTADGMPYDRNGDGAELSYGSYGRIFTAKNRRSFHGVCGDFEEGDASRQSALPMGDQQGCLSISGELDGNGKITSMTATVIGQADILTMPEDDEDQMTFKFTIKAGPAPSRFYNRDT